MKKFLAIILAVIMVCSMSLFAFAAETEVTLDKATPSGDVIIKTATTDGEGKDAKSYSITIPADTVIPWGKEATDLVYSVEAHLGHKEYVKVDVTGSGNMTYDPGDGTEPYKLPYTLEGVTSYQAANPVVYPAAPQTLTVKIEANNWNAAVVGEYSDNLTFTASLA